MLSVWCAHKWPRCHELATQSRSSFPGLLVGRSRPVPFRLPVTDYAVARTHARLGPVVHESPAEKWYFDHHTGTPQTHFGMLFDESGC